MPGHLNPASVLEGLYALKHSGIWASAFAKHLGRWSMWRPRAALHQTVPVLIFALLKCAQKKPKEGGCVIFICSLKIKQTLLALNHPLASVWCPVLVGKSGMGWTAQLLIEVELMSWWKLEESHSSFWFGLMFLGCIVQSWHFLADGSVMLNFPCHSGPCHTPWADFVSIACETWISADFKPCQNHQTGAGILNVVLRADGVSREDSGQQKAQFVIVWTEIHSSWWDAQ